MTAPSRRSDVIHLRDLPLPCPLNALYFPMPIRTKGGRMVNKMINSTRSRERKKLLVAAIQQQLGGAPEPMTGPVQVTYTVTPRDRRTPDVDAYEKHLLDCLQAAGVYANDKQVVQVSKERLEPKHPGSIDVQVWEVGA
jgi:Holliday junction resolvase RusA-like endonuclease